MKILHLLNRIDETGNGITNVAVDLACEQAARGHEVAVVSVGGGFESLLADAGVAHRRVDFTVRRPLPLLAALLGLWRIGRDLRPDVVHAHTITPAVLASLVMPRVRLVATVHNEYQRGVSLMRVADVVVGVSESVAVAARRWSRRSAAVATVYNGVLGSRRRQDVLPGSDRVAANTIVTVGAVSRRKGADVLLDAFAIVRSRVQDAELLFVGNVDWPDEIARREQEPYMRHVRFHGFDRNPQRFLGPETLFVMASRRDPFPLAILEALEAGCAIVGVDVDGIPEALDRGTSGIVVPSEDVEAVAAALIRVLEEPALRRRYSAAALQRSARFTVQHMTSEYLELYGRG